MIKNIDMKWNQYHITVYQHGNGNVPVLFLHGGGVDSAMLSWRSVMEQMPDRYTAYAIDLPGYGNSDRPEDICGSMFYEKQISAVRSITEQLHLEQFVLAGLSMGGAIVIGFALEYPERVLALIPVDSWGLVSRMPYHRLLYRLLQTNMMKISFRLFGRYKWLVRWSLTSSLIGDRKKVTEKLTDEVFELCRLPDAERSMVDFQRSSMTRDAAIPDYTKRFGELKMPVLFVNGEKDSLVRLRDAVLASEKVKDSSLHIMKGCRHWSQRERPEEFAEVLDGFLQKQR